MPKDDSGDLLLKGCGKSNTKGRPPGAVVEAGIYRRRAVGPISASVESSSGLSRLNLNSMLRLKRVVASRLPKIVMCGWKVFKWLAH